jgi:hypothetical protein
MSEQRFRAVPVKDGKGLAILVPFDPNEIWGAKERHHVTGTVQGCKVRGPMRSDGDRYYLGLGPAWVRDHPLPVHEVEVILRPEGPQSEALSEDVAAALELEPEAKAFFSGLATFYRKGYINWIESAKRPETRSARIAEMVGLLKAGRKQR